MDPRSLLIIGANGQLGTALRHRYPNAKFADMDQLDIASQESVEGYDWSGVDVIINAAAFTDVDGAETPEGRLLAWRVNAEAVARLVRVAALHNMTLVHISTDYVFDGTKELHTEAESLSPLGVYGQSKAAGDIAAFTHPKHYLLRTSWVIGSGKNFVRSMADLASKNISPEVVDDQFGRPTFTIELVRAIDHILTNGVEFGIYNVSNGGQVVSWADIAREVYRALGRTDLFVGDTTAEKYFAGKISSPRPTHSGLDLSKIESTGFKPTDWRVDLANYVSKELAK